MARKTKQKTPQISAKYEQLKATYAQAIIDTLVELDHAHTAGILITMPAHKTAAEHMSRLRKAYYQHGQKFADYPADQKKNAKDTIFAAFSALLDPSHNRKGGKAYKYLHWICPQFLNYRHNDMAMLVEDFSKHRADLQDFDNWSARLAADGKPNQIDDASLAVDGFRALAKILGPYQYQRAEKQEQAAFRRLSDEDKQRIDQGTSTLYEGEEGRVLMIHNWEASKFWGSHTRWCITDKDTDEHFRSYHGKSPVIFYLPTPNAHDFRKNGNYTSFKHAAVDGSLYDEWDMIVTEKFPECLHRLACAMEEHFQNNADIAAYLRDHALTHLITRDFIDLDDDTPASPPLGTDKLLAGDEMYQQALHIESLKTDGDFVTPDNHDDFAHMVKLMQFNIRFFTQASDHLKNNPDFLRTALEIEYRNNRANTAEKATPVSGSDEFISLAATDHGFAKSALAINGAAICVLPVHMQLDEDLALTAITSAPLNIMRSLDLMREEGAGYTQEDRLNFLGKAMKVSPGVLAMIDELDEFDIKDITDRMWLDMLRDHPYAMGVVIPATRWLRGYSERYDGDIMAPESPRSLVLNTYKSYAENKDRITTYMHGIFTMHSHLFTQIEAAYDPEILLHIAPHTRHVPNDPLDASPFKDDVCLHDFKRRGKFNIFDREQLANPRLMRDVLTHAIESGREDRVKEYLHHIPYLQVCPRAEALMSCEFALKVTAFLAQDDAPMPAFDELTAAFDAHHGQTAQNEVPPPRSIRPKR